MKKTIYIIIGLIVLVAAIVLINQNMSAPTETVAAPMAFDNTQYRLSLYNGIPIEEGSDYMVSFMDGRISATFCNGVGGEFTATDTMIASSEMVSTMMLCETPVYLMDLEQNFTTLFEGEGASYLLEGDLLTLSQGENLMVFTAVTQ